MSWEQLQLLAAVGCLYLRSTSQCSLCLATDRNHHDDYGEWFVAATLWIWHVLSHHDNYNRNNDNTQSLPRPVSVSLEHRDIRLATDRQFVWAMRLYWSTNRNGNQ